MKVIFFILMLSLGASLFAPDRAMAQTENIAFSTCLKNSVTDNDRETLVKYTFFGMAKHPNLAKFSIISPTDREKLNKELANVFTNLITVSCKSEFKAAVILAVKSGDKSGFVKAFSDSFRIIGEQGMTSLMSDAEVQTALQEFVTYLDEEKIGRAILN
jgi:hypothetical protein